MCKRYRENDLAKPLLDCFGLFLKTTNMPPSVNVPGTFSWKNSFLPKIWTQRSTNEEMPKFCNNLHIKDGGVGCSTFSLVAEHISLPK